MAREKWTSVVQEFLQKCFEGAIGEAVELLDPEVTYHVPGSNSQAGHFKGAQAVAQHISALLALTEHTVNVLQWEDWMLGVNYVAVLIHLRVQRIGEIHTFRTIYLAGMSREDKIRSVEIFFDDQAAADRILQ